jgi:plasmid replication initiation protein
MDKIVKLNVREHHNILRFLSHTTLIEKKVFMNLAYELNKLKPKDYKNVRLYPISIPMDKLMQRTDSGYKEIKRICRKLMSKMYSLDVDVSLGAGKTEKGERIEILFPACTISDNIFKIEIMTTLLPYFSRELKKYRNYNIIEAKFLKHKHSIELYKFLKDQLNQDKKTLKISIEKIKYELGLENKYNRYENFKMRVLEPTKQDLKEHSVLYFTYKELKSGRKVTELRINIHENRQNKEDIFILARLETYIKNTPDDDFKKDFEDFLKNDYCYSKLSKQTIEADFQTELKKLKNKHSISDYPIKIQKQFINFLEPQLF